MIGDIGSGLGQLVQAIIASTPATQGILFDLPHVTEKAKRVPLGRLSLQAGDFFASELPSCGAYLLMDIIHDWDLRLFLYQEGQTDDC